MEIIGFIVVFVVVTGVVLRLSDGRENGRRLGPGAPARFLHFSGRRLIVK